MRSAVLMYNWLCISPHPRPLLAERELASDILEIKKDQLPYVVEGCDATKLIVAIWPGNRYK